MPRASGRRWTAFLAACALTATAVACSSHGSQGQRGSAGGHPTLAYKGARGSGCGGTRVRLGHLPSWASGRQHGFHHGGSNNKVPYALSADGRVLAYLWGWPLAVHPDSEQDKVLWFARSIIGALHISGHRIGAAQPVFSETITGGSVTGMPSYVQTPAPGCWHLSLYWNYSQHSTINLRYVAHR